MKYKINPDKEYHINLNTKNQHHETWTAMCAEFEKKTEVSGFVLEGISMRYGKGNNKGNTDYFNYIVKSEWIIPA